MSLAEAPGAFIERYGLVQYTDRLGVRYPRAGQCELGACRWLLAAQLERLEAARRQLAALEHDARQLAERHAELLAWRPTGDSARRQRRRELDAARRRRRELNTEAAYLADVALPAYEAAHEQGAGSGRGALLVFDHCHHHGWVRGLVCMACNNALIPLEHRLGSYARGELLKLLEAHLAKCPECQPRRSLAERH